MTQLGDYERLEKMLRAILDWVTDALITLPEIEGPGMDDAYREIAYDCSRIATRADLVLIEIDKQRKGMTAAEGKREPVSITVPENRDSYTYIHDDYTDLAISTAKESE